MSESSTPIDPEETDEEYIPKAFYILFAWLAIVTLGGILLLLAPGLPRALAEVFLFL